MGEAPKKSTVWNSIKPFVNGGASGMLATCVIQPIDMVKVRIQLGASGSPVRLSSSCCSCTIALSSGLCCQKGASGLAQSGPFARQRQHAAPTPLHAT